MPNARIVLAFGAINGSNRVFSAGEPYVPGSVAYILNGRIHNQKLARGVDNDYGFIELDANAGTIEVDNAPLTDDVVQLFFWDRRVQPQPTVTRMSGVVSTKQHTEGIVREPRPERLVGTVSPKQIQGVIRQPEPERLVGSVGTKRVTGVIREKCP